MKRWLEFYEREREPTRTYDSDGKPVKKTLQAYFRALHVIKICLIDGLVIDRVNRDMV